MGCSIKNLNTHIKRHKKHLKTGDQLYTIKDSQLRIRDGEMNGKRLPEDEQNS